MKKHAKKIVVALLVVAMLVPTVAMLYSSAATAYPVELAFNNLFIFEEWANNENSTTVVYGGEIVGEIESNISNGEFTLKKTKVNADKQAYNGHGESKTDSIKNTDYYSIPVEPNTAYRFSYNLNSVTGGSITPYLFMFDSSFLCRVTYGAPGANTGANSFIFITPSDVNYLQFRFTFDAETTGEATISNISLTKSGITLNSTNLFNFDSWANSNSGKNVGVVYDKDDQGKDLTLYDNGTFERTASTKSIAIESYGDSVFTGASLIGTSGYYTISVKPNTSYVLKCTLVNSHSTDFQEFVPYITIANNTGGIEYIAGCGATGYGSGSYVFTTKADTVSISPVFTTGNGGALTIRDIELLEATDIEDNRIATARVVKNYGSDATYGTLPILEAPENYVFTGWNTKEDGTGMRITADTPVQPMSLTVYPKFEPDIEVLAVVTNPTKTVYTVGEKIDTTGLVLQVTDTYTVDVSQDTDGDGTLEDSEIKTEERTETYNITSGYYITPEYAGDTAGSQTITVHYGEETATFNITVKESDPGKVIVNGISTDVTIANNEYTFNLSTSAFNRYEVTYKSDSYVSGVATFNDGKTEEFFLEPSDNGSFGSFVDDLFEGNTYNQVVKIKFTTLDKENGQFELYSLNTVNVTVPSDTVYKESPSGKFQMGVSLAYGGVVSELYDVSDEIYARTYSNGSNDITLVDYKAILDEEGSYKSQSDKVNLINTFDRGRYLQQSYYGTGDKPYIGAEYNNAAWPYNPVQGGNAVKESSKIIDYKVTNDYIYVKARPLDWAKWSDEYVDDEGRDIYEQIEWGDDYITDTYVEAWYYFQGDVIKVANRKVDYSGLPEASHSQEYPALYLIEPLNHFVYNNVSAQDAWAKTTEEVMATQTDIEYVTPSKTNKKYWEIKNYVTADSLMNIEEPEYWGLVQLYKDEFDIDNYEPWVNVNENWAAFTASENPNSFGVGLYTDVTNKFYYGIQPEVYVQEAGDSEGSVGSVTDTTAYRHATTLTPTEELATSYIAPTDTAVFRSYEPTEFTYYLATGTAAEIREDFATISNAEEERAKPKIAVPETVYLDPANNTDGQYYVNNVMNENNYYSIEPTVESTYMYLGFHVENAAKFSVNITNVDDPSNDPFVGNWTNDGTAYDTGVFNFDDENLNDDTVIFYDQIPQLGLHLTNPLDPGETNTVKWDITITYENNTQETFTAYTVMYAPHRTVGAVAEARQVDASQNEISSWITGANGVDHSKQAPLSTLHADKREFGYFKKDPLVYPNELPTGGTGESANDYINVGSSSNDYYVMQAATNGHDSSRSQSYLGLLTIDESRYTNTDQIPNLRIGFDALRIGSWTKDSLTNYKAYYTLGTDASFTSTELSATPSGWTEFINQSEYANSHSLPDRQTVVPSYKVSEVDGKYIHALNQGTAVQDAIAARYSTAGTSVLISVTDKSALRDAVTDGYSSGNDDPEFLEKLEEAATILGTPGASQEDIDRITDDIDDYLDTFYALKYDNLFSAYEFSQHSNSMSMTRPQASVSYENGVITTTTKENLGTHIVTENGVEKEKEYGETYTKYDSAAGNYLIALKPNTEYVFEYDVTTDSKAQAFMFFYNSSGGGSEPPTEISKKVNNGAWTYHTEGSPWWGNYTNSAGTYHYVIKFTTGATTAKAGFRFGNTSNDVAESIFSNIRLVESTKYYEDVQYTMTEDVYKEYAYYDNLQTPVRNGYVFNGWFDAEGNEVTSIDTATEHKSVYSDWTILKYTITYDANGGSVSPASATYTVDEPPTIPTPTRSGYTFTGWTVTIADGNWEFGGLCQPGAVPAGMYGNVTLTAQWVLGEVDVYFDSILDFDKWNTTSASDATISNVTLNGFTLTSNAGVDEGCSSSPYFDVEPGESYKVDIDITGNNWDVYVFFCNENGSWVDFDDTTNRYSSNGHGPADRVFTAPDNTSVVKAQIRLDANNGSNSVTFSDIRVYEADTCAPNVDVPYTNKRELEYGSTFGTLPVPTREGYEFLGWYDENGIKVTAESTVNYASDVYLKSKWVISNEALAKDTAVIDFSSPIDITPLANDTVYASAEGERKFLGFSSDGTNYGATTINGTYGTFAVSGETVTYTPSKAVDGVDTIYYHASVTADGVETKIKNEITVVPASNVLYEETFFSGNDAAATGKDWTVVSGTAAKQNSSPIADEKYGYDSNTSGYNKFSTYSNGSAKTVTVSDKDMMSKITAFTFKGTGFDLNSACGAKTGIMVVSLKNNATNKMVKSYVVDTYYGDAAYGDANSSNTLYQVPVISETGLDHGNYTVQVSAAYLPSMSGAIKADKAKEAEEQQKLQPASANGLEANIASGADNEALRNALAELGLDYIFDAEEVEVVWFDDNSVLNGGMGADTPVAGDTLETAALDSLFNVIDSVRVYKPIDNGNDYYIDTEKNASYYNVIDNLVDTTNGSLTGTSFFAYITGKLGVDEEGNDIQLSVSNYNSVGPKNELYLSESTSAVAFKIKNYDTIKSTGGRIMISLRAASGTPKVQINTTDFSVISNTEMYYDITDYITDGTVTILNSKNSDTDKSLLAIGNLKITCPVSAAMASLSPDVDLETVRMMMMSPSVTVEPNTTPTPEVPEEPEDPNEPENPEEPEEPAEECWLVKIFKWIFNTAIKIFSALKGFLAI